MNYSEKKYGRNIVSQRSLPSKSKKVKTVKIKVKTLWILLITFLILGIVIGSTISNIHTRKTLPQCVDTLKGGELDG